MPPLLPDVLFFFFITNAAIKMIIAVIAITNPIPSELSIITPNARKIEGYDQAHSDHIPLEPVMVFTVMFKVPFMPII